VRYGRRAADPKDVLDLYQRTREEGFGPEVKRRIILGTFVLSAGYTDAYYRKAQKVRGLIRQDFEKAFQGCDLLLTPTSPEPAFKLGERTQDPLKMYLADVFTISVNLAGTCGISLPCGFTKSNLPIGLQLIGPRFGEEKMLQAAHAYEQSHDFWKRMPPV
jgi:aspartyl-tRNA(Asn)/glutamyl-tRNA(Gln) amidotransferase subunit A